MRRLTVALLAFALLSGPAIAQLGRKSRQPTAEEIQKKKDAAEIERRYKATIKATPAPATGPKDPWAIVRGIDGKSGQQ